MDAIESGGAVRGMEEVLPWLAPRELASIACTCRAMALAVAPLTHLRVSDLARGLESWPVPVLNVVDPLQYPYFVYSHFCSLPSFAVLPRQPWGGRIGCNLNADSQGGLLVLQGESTVVGCRCFVDCSENFSCMRNGGPEKSGLSNGPSVCADYHMENRVSDCVGSSSGTWDGILCSSVPKKARRLDNFERCAACPCGRTSDGQHAYDSNSRLQFLTRQDGNDGIDRRGTMLNEDFGIPSVQECGAACLCDATCKHRVSQQGIAVKVSVVRQRLKGWSLYSDQAIAKGTFVCEYAGELLTTPGARARQQLYDTMSSQQQQKFSTALLVLREHLPSQQACLRLNIDATRVGNVARFINHACDGGNLLPCLIRLRGSLIPKLAFFAKKDILEGEELTFSYGQVEEGSKSQPCFCGVAECKGVLPSEQT
eukprot:c28307_g1_i4 orf=180-1457(+)